MAPAAKVVDHEPAGNRPPYELIGDTVRVLRAAGDLELPVPVGLDVSRPVPAPERAGGDLVEEPAGKGRGHAITPSVCSGPGRGEAPRAG